MGHSRGRKQAATDPDELTIDATYRPARRPTHPRHIVTDPQAMKVACQFAGLGASVGTIEARLGLARGKLAQWLARGAKRSEPEDSPYRMLYEALRSESATATAIAEATLREKNPAAWLDRNTLSRTTVQDEPTAEQPQAHGTQALETHRRLAALTVASQAILHQQGYGPAPRITQVEARPVEPE